MSKFTVSKEVLNEYLRLNELSGNIQSKELPLVIQSAGMSTYLLSPNQKERTMLIKSSLVGTFEDLGELGIDLLPPVRRFLSSPSTPETLSVSKTANKLNFEFKKANKWSAHLRDPKYIMNKPDAKVDFDGTVEKFKGAVCLVLPAAEVKTLADITKSIDTKTVMVSVKDTEVKLSYDGSKQDSTIMQDSIVKAATPFEIKFGVVFLSMLEDLQGYDITMYLDPTMKAAYIILKTKDFNFQYILRGIS